MNKVESIKPGPKPDKPDGTPDRRRRVTPETQPKHPGLKPHIHKPGEKKIRNIVFRLKKFNL